MEKKDWLLFFIAWVFIGFFGAVVLMVLLWVLGNVLEAFTRQR